MEYKDYYKIMGLNRDATLEDIKRAHRKLARKYHPDISKEADAEAKFKEVGEAYKVLKDPVKRAAYDRLGRDFKSGQEFNPPPNWDAGFEFNTSESGNMGNGFSDFFEELFGRQRHTAHSTSSRQFSNHGQDQHAKVSIDLEDAFHGATRSIKLQTPVLDGHGQIRMSNHTLNIKIPKGIKEGQQIRLAGQGSPGIGNGPPGDLYLEVNFNPHPLYRVEGRDLHMQLPVTPWEVALGETVKVPTPAGTVDLKIAAGSNSGSKLRLKGRGIPGVPAGNLYLTLSVMTPQASSEEAKALYKKMADTLAFNPRMKMGV